MANYDIGRIQSTRVSRNNYSVTTSDSTDVFEFNVYGSRQIGLYLHDLQGGDADLRLYRDTNNNGIFDSGDQQVASSTNGGTSSDSITYTTPTGTGTYFAQVSRYSGTSVSYDLDFSAIYDRVGTVGETPSSLNRYSVSSTDPTDVFKLNVSGTRNLNLSLNNISTGDNANLTLYRDSNNNGVFDTSDQQIAYSRFINNRDEQINYQATTGTYFAQVERYAPQSQGSVYYDLDISATSTRTASNLLGSEIQLGNIAGDRILSSSVSNSDTTDTYAFSLGLYEGVNFELDLLSNDADIRVIRDSNNNGFVDAGEVIGSSTRGGSTSEMISGIDQSGDYLLQIYQYSGNTSYRLTVDHYNTTFA